MTGVREQKIGHEAAKWVVKFDGVDFNASHVRAFRRWLDRSPGHRAAFERASKTWNQLDLLAKLEAAPLPALAPAGLSRRALIGGTAGAVVAGAGAIAFFAAEPALAYETTTGEMRELVLPDGTQALLGADTRIEARINADRRSVRVLRGEALFSIAQRGDDPLSITAPSGGVDALHGEVLVKVLPEGSRVSLLSQAAQTWRGNLRARQMSGAAAAQTEIEFGSANPRVSQLDAPTLTRRLAWRDGRLAFDNAPLAEAVADVSRQTGAQFVFAEPSLRDRRIVGLIDARNLDAFLGLLRENLRLETRVRPDGTIELASAA